MKFSSVLMAVLAVLAMIGIVQAAPDVSILPAEVRGIVLFPDGKTPVDRLRVRVWNADTEEIVYKTKTDKGGVFGVPKLDPIRKGFRMGGFRVQGSGFRRGSGRKVVLGRHFRGQRPLVGPSFAGR